MTAIFALWIFVITGLDEGAANSCKNNNCECCINKACWESGYCIYGCINGIYGDKCYNDCPSSCTNGTCDRNIAFYNETGEKKEKHYCETCPRGWYRGYTINKVECKEECPERCQTCTMAVLELTQTVTCGECNGSFYGENCSLPCPERCLNCTSTRKCDECKPDYHNRDGMTDCSFNCPKHCLCSRSGSCDSCIKGFYGTNVNCSNVCPGNCDICSDRTNCSKCKTGYYGSTCEGSCSVGCINDTCDKHTGHCNCRPDFDGKTCDNCTAGLFGTNCSSSCHSQTCKDKYCKRDTGDCTACELGKYGSLCMKNCSLNCEGETCNFTDGTCNVCRDSYSGDKCCLNGSNCEKCSSDTECEKCVSAFHGDACEKRCHVNCKELICEKEFGNCSLGCISGFQGPICSEALSERTPEIFVGGGVLAFAVVVVVVLVIVFFVKRRRKDLRKQPSSGTNSLPTDTDETEERATRPHEDAHHWFAKSDGETPSYFNRDSATLEDQLEQDNEEILTDVACPPNDTYCNYTPKVKISRLYDYVMQKPYKEYRQEFQVLPKGIQKPCTVARQPENVVKNRYASIYAYDGSRVKIMSEPAFYINACYVYGYKTGKAYITSLGPTLKATENFVTFWKMVWNEKTDVIVMLTNLNEPSEAAGRKVTQFHFTAWPDKSVPESIITLVEFWLRVRLLAESTSGPVIVHCSAGVGRTGTYIALDRLITEGRAEGSVNIHGCILDLREQRVDMVQTTEQYIYLHKCLAYTLTFDCDPIQSDSFRQYVESAGDSKFQTQFMELQRKMEDTDKEENEAREKNQSNTKRNRKDSDIPGNRKRPRLYFNRNFNDSDYINASYVDGFKRRDSYILAQTPLPATVEDFLCLLVQENCICVVSLDSADMKSKDIGEYLPPDNQTLTVSSFTVTGSKCEGKQDYVSKTVTIQFSAKSRGDKQTIHYFQYTNWKESSDTPEDAGSFVQFVKDVEMKAITNSADFGKPTVVHCLTGARRSGVFCVVAILLEKLQIERQASVVNIVRQIRAGRESAIHCKEQLEFCYRCAAAYTELFSTYSNFTA